MQSHNIKLCTRLHHSAQTVVRWYQMPSAFERLLPPWHSIKILSKQSGPGGIGTRFFLKVKIAFFWKKWEIQHTAFQESQSISDVQIKGPFSIWKHTYRVVFINDYTCDIEDEVEFFFPLNLFKKAIEYKAHKFLHWRHERLKNDLALLQKNPLSPQKILISGANGFVGTHLIPFLETAGHQVSRLVRHQSEKRKGDVYWDPKGEGASQEDLEGFDIFIHLAGKGITSGFWTEALKRQIRESRCTATSQLCETINKLKIPPQLVITASAFGIYGDREDEYLTESSPKGSGFLAEVCECWEAAAKKLIGSRIAHLRFGLILSSDGGLLKKMQTIFRLGMGAILGNGDQYMSWVAMDDVIYALYHVISNEKLEGAINFCSPNPQRNRYFSEKLAKSLSTPLLFRIGEKPLKLIGGEMAEELLLTSQRGVPEKLLSSGYVFVCPELDFSSL